MPNAESIDSLSREFGVEKHRLSGWRKKELADVQHGLASEQPAEPPELVTAQKALQVATTKNEPFMEHIRRGIAPLRRRNSSEVTGIDPNPPKSNRSLSLSPIREIVLPVIEVVRVPQPLHHLSQPLTPQVSLRSLKPQPRLPANVESLIDQRIRDAIRLPKQLPVIPPLVGLSGFLRSLRKNLSKQRQMVDRLGHFR